MIDHAVEEIRERRRRLLRERYGGSIQRLLEASRKWERTHPGMVTHLRKRSSARAVA